MVVLVVLYCILLLQLLQRPIKRNPFPVQLSTFVIGMGLLQTVFLLMACNIKSGLLCIAECF
uniref:Uncharacterized protein n=1 Tax=Anguilla anguilla TaxID=7936 RepID=A0A0E9WVK2_ANGAN